MRHLEVLRFFLSVGADIRSLNGGWSALHLAVLNNQNEMYSIPLPPPLTLKFSDPPSRCHELLRNGADWRMSNSNGQRCEDLAKLSGFAQLETFFRGMRETTEYELNRAKPTKTEAKRLKTGHYAIDL